MSLDFDRLVADAEAVKLEGWDFSFLDGRIEVEPEPWDYRTRVGELASTVRSLLDIGTGGGEFVASLDRRPPLTVATEAWMPNVPVAAARLGPLGVYLVADEGAPDNVSQGPDTERGRLAFCDGAFDAVINRHTSFLPREVARVLSRHGTLITQQVGKLNEIELNDALDAGPPGASPTLEEYVEQLHAGGLRVVRAEEARPRKRYLDIGAIAYNVKALVGQFSGLDHAMLRDRLHKIHTRIEREGAFVVHHHRLFLEAVKP